ncbi:hypothetical protein [Leptolyngbya sp. 7M]|uniref:hypothetical protein n=1 Tax=Leptolyngbya sp. 7M TaxID=2812896 RepID=UPI0021F1BA72|nr:hypothetical protein [Leptolyngbya sp. 7M]
MNAAAAYWPYVAAGGVAGGAIVPPLGLAIASGALIYGAWDAGETIARHPSNPFSRPWVSPDVIRPPVPPISACYPKPKPITWTIPYERSDGIPVPTPDRKGCAQEWADAYEWCFENMGKPDQRGGTGNYTNPKDCARGRVSARCGGNAV